MQTLPRSPPPPHAFRSSLRSRSRRCEIVICSDSLRTVNCNNSHAAEEDSMDYEPSRLKSSLRSSSYAEGIGFSRHGDGKGFCTEELEVCSSHQFKASVDKVDDDDDNMQWANAWGPPQKARQNLGYADGRGSYAARLSSVKRNKVRLPRKLASLSSVPPQHHSGPIKSNSGPFSGPLRVVRPKLAPSIIPVNILRKKKIGLDVREPVSPEVTCLGRIKIKESTEVTHASDARTPGADSQKLEKGRCFDAKNKLCGKKAKGRKKKKLAEKSRCLSRKRRFASKEGAVSQSFSSSVPLETRREKAASLARSLTGLLEDARRLDRDKQQYVPCVPPPNSLLLMRGGRVSGEPCSSIRRNVDNATVNDRYLRNSLRAEALDEDGSCDANLKSLSETAPQRRSLLDLIDMEDEEFSTSDMEDTMPVHRSLTEAQGTCLRLRENSEAAENDGKNVPILERSFGMRSPGAALWQRRAIAELTPIEVEQTANWMKKRISRLPR